ncbi:MAG: hypothetical protein AVDCRST_MAG35-2097 [uncultured Quadrisphaera sp.]|uniref:HNH nuclease domain-containing protein n=1 Tax=uncultured Quadrisphaera sp. TaxID=904978 RepID=A0A6J4PSC4_9ACTN|nr:MAG: hypothetical protein AVDCRST_MAG35-2097 [uncultured Quadrisphaera sp.]
MTPRRAAPAEEAAEELAGQPGREQRLRAAVAAQGGRCAWCARPFSALVEPTTDHLVPRVKGGPSWASNEVAACRRCNGQRGHVSPVEWYLRCRERGWEPDAALVVARLRALDAEITARGGQRRARPYLASQLRRLAQAAEVA